jgi:succinate-semialdehyde dehydrogenase / glutarate-semialdehyde dehydrogenase
VTRAWPARSGPASESTFDVIDPATLEIVGTVQEHDRAFAHEALDRASAALHAWGTTPPRDRSEILRRVFELLHRDRESLAVLVCRENGKSLTDAVAEVTYAADFFRWFSEECVRSAGNYGESPAGGSRSIIRHRPAGVAALITPWNFPVAMAARKLAPALAAGCTAVLKPAAETPLSALALADLIQEAGAPKGVVEVITTTDAPGVVASLLGDARVRKISFTGSTGVGRTLLRQAADRVLNSSMELGGNAAFVVTEDADLERAVDGAMFAKFRNGGQACTAANRFYVHESVAAEFVAAFGERVERLVLGPASEGADIGPLINQRAVDRVTAVVDGALREGARVAHRTKLPSAPGYFYPATVLTHVPQSAAILGEELFGPVAPVVTYSDETELLEQINGTEYGLAAYVYSRDTGRAISLAERVDAGMVAINRASVSDPSAPFGGVKQSGLGREGGREGIEAYQETQFLSVAW